MFTTTFTGADPIAGSNIARIRKGANGLNQFVLEGSNRALDNLTTNTTSITEANLKNTIFDPDLRKNGMYLDFGKEVRISSGDFNFNGRYLNIPAGNILPLGGEGTMRLNRTHRAIRLL